MRNIAALTSVRFLAALVVFFHHYLVLGGERHFGDDPGAHPMFRLLYEGRFGVSLFFVLSGFLLTARYYHDIHRGIDFKTYWIKRFARIMPLYWTICSLILVLHIADNAFQFHSAEPHDLRRFLVFFSLTQAFFDDLKFQGVETAWSLTVEETFYLALPALIVLLRRLWVDRWPLWRNLAIAGALLLAVSVSYYAVGLGLQGQQVFTVWGFFRGGEGWSSWRTFTICGRFFDFGVGMLFGLAYIKSNNAWLERRWLPDVAISTSTLGIMVGCYLTHLSGGIGGLESATGWWLNTSNACFSAVIVYFLCARGAWIARGLSWAPFVYLGQISYAFYLVHKLDYTNWMYRWFESHEVPMIVAMVLLYTSFSLMAAACYEIVERPVQGLILRATGVIRGGGPQPLFVRLLGAMAARVRREGNAGE